MGDENRFTPQESLLSRVLEKTGGSEHESVKELSKLFLTEEK